MTDSALLALAEEVEKAGPSRELDARIWCTVHGYRFGELVPFGHKSQCALFFMGEGSEPSYEHIENIPDYTTSIDAADSIETPGWELDKVYYRRDKVFGLSLWEVTLVVSRNRWVKGEGATETLARTAARLRALAAMEKE